MNEEESDPIAKLIGRLHADGKLPDDPRELAARLNVDPPPLIHHQITVSRVIDGHRKNLHDFGALDPMPPARWLYVPVPTLKQGRQFAERVAEQAAALPPRRLESIDPSDWRADPKAAYLRTAAHHHSAAVDFDELLPPPRRRLPVESWMLNHPEELVSLAADVQPPARIFTVVLDALMSDGRPELDLDKLKRVVSQLGSEISKLDKLAAGARVARRLELYATILERCSTLG